MTQDTDREELRASLKSIFDTDKADFIGVDDAFEMLQQSIHAWNDVQGFWASDNTGEKLMLMVSELAEAMEGDRKGLMDDKVPERTMLEVELADTLIRIFDFAGRRKLDLAGALFDKMRVNLDRPFMHGKRY